MKIAFSLDLSSKQVYKEEGMFRSYFRPIAAIAILAALSAYAAISLRGEHGLSALDEKRQAIRTMQEQNANLAREISDRKQHIIRLQSDPSTQELELERLGFVHEHDTQFKVGGQHKTNGASH